MNGLPPGVRQAPFFDTECGELDSQRKMAWSQEYIKLTFFLTPNGGRLTTKRRWNPTTTGVHQGVREAPGAGAALWQGLGHGDLAPGGGGGVGSGGQGAALAGRVLRFGGGAPFSPLFFFGGVVLKETGRKENTSCCCGVGPLCPLTKALRRFLAPGWHAGHRPLRGPQRLR